ncbi:MAG: GGDEF domain-containing protein [Pseudomonadota bacterium]
MTEYGETVRQADVLAHNTLALMAELGVIAHPENYTIFYHYLSGKNPDLSQTVDILRSNHQEFGELQCQRLHERFFGHTRETQTINTISESLRRQLTILLGHIQEAGNDTRAYGSMLGNFSSGLSNDDLASMRTALETVLNATHEMESHNKVLENRLDTSSSEISRLREDLEAMRREAMTDALTGIANRKMFDQKLRTCAMEAMETGSPMSLLLIDIDDFKKFNDAHGHQTGDQVIRLLAQTLKQSVKGRDTAARYGGEEFAVILPQTGIGCARQLAEQIRHAISSKKIVSKISHQDLGQITVSIGVGNFKYGEPLGRLIARTDQALYHAKATGRNRVVSQNDIDDPANGWMRISCH